MRTHLLRLTLLALVAFSFNSPTLYAAGGGEGEDVDYAAQVMHHISDANEMHFWGDIHIPLPILAYSFTDGLYTGMSSDFYAGDGGEHGPHAGAGEAHHGDHEANGDHDDHAHHGPTRVINGYFLDHGVLRRLADPAARQNVHSVDRVETSEVGGESGLRLVSNGKSYAVEDASTVLGFTDWIDFSITKNVATMLMAMIVFGLIFFTVRNGYTKNKGRAPRGIQSFFEPIILFVRDDIAKEMVGPKWEKYFPFLASLFFFILIINLFGLIPIAPFGANVTGNIGFCLALALITFLIVSFSGNSHYWGHIFWMPGVPLILKPLMAIIEFLGIFIKPFTLMIRLFANITAGHIIILSLVGLIFLFGDNGASVGGATAGAAVAIPFVFVMNLLEIFVAFLQAFIFTLLAALYIGSAIEEHHHDDHVSEHVAHVPA